MRYGIRIILSALACTLMAASCESEGSTSGNGNGENNQNNNQNNNGNNENKENNENNGNGDNPDTKSTFVVGADISWASEMDHDGKTWKDASGSTKDIMDLMFSEKEHGIRLRVWVDPDGGWSGQEDVVLLAERAMKANPKTRLMIDFHYSDFFADPGRQNIPQAWTDHSIEALKAKISNHTSDILNALKTKGITPEWVQIGNETRNGMLWPAGQLWNESGDIKDGWKNFAALCNAGYAAAKAVFPDIKVIIHLNNAWEDNAWWFSKFMENGGLIDMIGLSHYPMTESDKTWSNVNSLAVSRISSLKSQFKLPVMVCEVGVKVADSAAQECLDAFMSAAKDKVEGVFYWEPEVYGGWKPAIYNSLGWHSYDMGAFSSDGGFTPMFTSFWNN